MLEIHGKQDCPFAWRARVSAHERKLEFDWIPYDAEPHDPRADSHNAEHKSPKIVDGEFELIESLVILEYLDEQYGQPAQDPKERAKMRVRFTMLHGMEHHPPDPKKLRESFKALDHELQNREWLGGAQPDSSDFAAWPFLWVLEKHLRGFPNLERYWVSAKTRPSLTETKP